MSLQFEINKNVHSSIDNSSFHFQYLQHNHLMYFHFSKQIILIGKIIYLNLLSNPMVYHELEFLHI